MAWWLLVSGEGQAVPLLEGLAGLTACFVC